MSGQGRLETLHRQAATFSPKRNPGTHSALSAPGLEEQIMLLGSMTTYRVALRS